MDLTNSDSTNSPKELKKKRPVRHSARSRPLVAAVLATGAAASLSLLSGQSMAADPIGTVNSFPPEAGVTLAGDAIQWQGEILANRTTAGFTAFNPTTGVAVISPLITTNPVKTMTVFNGQLAWIDATSNVVKTANPGGVITALTGTVPATADSMLAVGSQLWISRAGGIDRYTPTATALGPATPLPTTFGATSVLRMAAAPDGTIWVIEKNAPGVDTLGRYNNTGTPSGTAFNFANSASDPTAIVAGADGGMWVIQAGLNAVARFDAVSFAAGEIVLPAGANPTSLALGSDGGVWVTETALNSVSRLTWSAGNFIRTPVAAPSSFGLKSVIAGPDGNMWAVGTIANRIAKFGAVPAASTTTLASTTTVVGTSTTIATATTTTPPTTTPPTTTPPTTAVSTPAPPTTSLATVPPTATPAPTGGKVCVKSAKRRVRVGKKFVTRTVCLRYRVR